MRSENMRRWLTALALIALLCLYFALVTIRVLGQTSIYVCPATATVCLPPKPHTFQRLLDLGIGVSAAVAVGVALGLFIRRRLSIEREAVGKQVKRRRR